jgi:molybdate transport system permease protein
VVFAQIFVSAPFFMRAAVTAFGQIPDELFDVARADGAGSMDAFRLVALPIAWRALVGGLVVAWARAAGEFGATIIFAGNYPGRTQTMPLAIYLGFEVNLREAMALSVVLMAVALVGFGLAYWIARDDRN